MSARPRTKLAVTSCALIALGAVGCGERSARVAVPTLVDRHPAQVERLVVTGDDGRAKVVNRGDSIWVAQGKTSPEATAIMTEAEGSFFPLLAYHQVQADQSDPAFGLTDPAYTITVVGRDGKQLQVFLGAETFNGEGVYARRPGDERIYLVPRKIVNDVRSLLTGKPVTVEHPVEQRFEEFAQRAERAADAPDLWLQQAEESGARLPEELR